MTLISNIINNIYKQYNFPITILVHSKYLEILSKYIDDKKYKIHTVSDANRFNDYPILIIDQSQLNQLNNIYIKYYSKIIVIDDVSESIDSNNMDYWKTLKTLYHKYEASFERIIFVTFNMESFLYSEQAHNSVINIKEFNTLLSEIL